MDPLFPDLPEDLSALSDEELQNLLKEHEAAAELIEKEDEEFIKGMEADSVLAALKAGVEQIEAIVAEQEARVKAQEEYLAEKQRLADRRKAAVEAKAAEEEEPAPDDGDDEGSGDEEEVSEEAAEVVAEAEAVTEEAAAAEEAEPVEEEKVAVTASTNGATPVEEPKEERKRPPLRRPPAPTASRQVQTTGAALVAAAGLQEARAGAVLNRKSLAETMKKEAVRRGKPSKNERGNEERILIARADFQFPEENILTGNIDSDTEKLAAILPANVPGGVGRNEALVASGGLCAPLTPIYTMPNFATADEPVWDALPKFQADRGGVNTPAATIIGDITTAISNITEANDALGGTFATKSCQDLTCVEYTEVAVQILAHCREYGNLNAMAWPEKIAHENDLTMAALSRTSETFMLDRIKALSVNVTNGAETLGALIYLVDAIVKARFGIIGRLRMPRNSRFRALLPYWVPEMLALDTIQTIDGNRFTSDDALVAYLRDRGIEPVFYLDSPSDGTTQLPDASQTAAALDPLPDNVQWAIYPEGAFIGVDSGSLELGIVRDSTLNSTNDFQIFGERFRNVARLAPAQAAYWVTSDLCAIGQFPPAGTARTCD